MAKKTIVYEARLKNGHGEWIENHVAPTKLHLEEALEGDNVKVLGIKSIGQKEVNVVPNEDYDQASYTVDLGNGEELNISQNDLGNNFMRSKFKTQTDKLEKELNDNYDPFEE